MGGITNILCLAVMAGVFISVNATDYCKLSCGGVPHTMCTHKSAGPGPNCQQPGGQGLSSGEKDAIVRKHNELRQKVASGNEKRGKPGPQPAAVSMPDLTWDNELETVAQRWASQCTFAHDKCRKVDRFPVGQNIAISWFSGKNSPKIEGMVQDWYDEVANFNNRDVSSYSFAMNTGHYTQVVWAGTTKIGCGQMKYKDRGMNTVLLVCNYGAAGNWKGEKMYEIKK